MRRVLLLELGLWRFISTGDCEKEGFLTTEEASLRKLQGGQHYGGRVQAQVSTL